MDSKGRFVAGTRAGTYENGLTVEVSQGSITRTATSRVTVTPGKVARLEITGPGRPLRIGEKVSLEFGAFDAYDNPVPDAEAQWSVSGPANNLGTEGTLTAGTAAGPFVAHANLTMDGETLAAEAPFTILPNPLDQVVITPNPAHLGIGAEQQFSAVGTDESGNEIHEVHFDWEVESGSGTINAHGAFTAGMELGVYDETAGVTASRGDVSVIATAGVIVRPTTLKGAVGGPSLAVTGGTVDGSLYAFYGSGPWLVAADVSNPRRPVEVGRLPLQSYVRDIFLSDGDAILLVANDHDGLRIVDVSNPSTPAAVGSLRLAGPAFGVFASSTLAFVAAGNSGLRIVDISKPSAPSEVGSFHTRGSAEGVFVKGNSAFVADGEAGLIVVDISEPSAPVDVGVLDTPSRASGVFVSEDLAFVGDGDSGAPHRRRIGCHGPNTVRCLQPPRLRTWRFCVQRRGLRRSETGEACTSWTCRTPRLRRR